MKKTLFILSLLIGFTSTYAQTAKEVFENYINSKKAEQEYQMDISYSLYKGKEGDKAYERYSGLQAKHNHVIYQKLAKTEFVLGTDFMVKLNTDEKAMLVGYSSTPIFENADLLDNAKILEVFKNKTLEDKGNYWKLILTEPNNTALSEFAAIELHLNKNNLILMKQIFHYALASDFSTYSKDKTNPDFDNPRLEIDFSNYKRKVDLKEHLFTQGRYFEYKDNKILASTEFKDFEILYAN